MTKSIHWLGHSRSILQTFEKSARAEIGYQLYRLQQGLLPTDYKPMKTIATGVWEIRTHRPYEHRVIYTVKLKSRIYVLHAFKKKSQKTPKSDLEIAVKNYQELMWRIQNIKIKTDL